MHVCDVFVDGTAVSGDMLLPQCATLIRTTRIRSINVSKSVDLINRAHCVADSFLLGLNEKLLALT